MGKPLKKILVVEDSRFFAQLVEKELGRAKEFSVVWARDMAHARQVLDEHGNRFFAAILDFNLPDAPHGEVIPEVVGRDIPTIVFTANLSDEVRDAVWSSDVVDYVLKSDVHSLDYLTFMLFRLERNPLVKVLVVDDSSFFRKLISSLLRVHRYQVLEAGDGEEALAVLAAHPDVRLVITDSVMPKKNGLELTQEIRSRFSREELAIIGISAQGENIMAARFIKNGANDFVIKQSFLREEFYSRVNQCIESLENIEKIRETAVRDFLTGLYNRRYFFEAGGQMLAGAGRHARPCVCAMLDIDFFKKVNDSHGHEAGDCALRHVATILKNRMRRTDIVARLGGEEFCILAAEMQAGDAARIFENLRISIEKTQVDLGAGKRLNITASLGVAVWHGEGLEELLRRADALLYAAKSGGRNRVAMEEACPSFLAAAGREEGAPGLGE